MGENGSRFRISGMLEPAVFPSSNGDLHLAEAARSSHSLPW